MFYWTLTDSCDDGPWEKKGTGDIPAADKGYVVVDIHAWADGVRHCLRWDGRWAFSFWDQ